MPRKKTDDTTDTQMTENKEPEEQKRNNRYQKTVNSKQQGAKNKQQTASSEEKEQVTVSKKQTKNKLPKEKDAPWPSKTHDEPVDLGDSHAPSLPNFIIGFLFLALIACGGWYLYTRGMFDSVVSSLSDRMHPVEEPLPTAIPTSVPEQTALMPGDVPLADELTQSKGIYRWCIEHSLGEAMMPLATGDRTPTEDEQNAITYCQTQYWEDSRIACLPSDTISLTTLGTVITYDDAGLSSGFIADSTGVKMADGRIRLYFEAGDKGIVSAISTESLTAPYDSVTFHFEGTVINPGFSHPRALVLGDGRTRIFARKDNAIYSFISDDGFFFNQEDGVRISGQDVGFDNITGVGIVTTDTGYRMYIGNALVSDDVAVEDRPDLIIKSAVSEDMLTWRIEDGVRLGAGSQSKGFVTTDDQQKAPEADHPFVLTTSDGKILAAFGSTNSSCIATSSDGLTFDRPVLISEEHVLKDSSIGGDTDLVELEPNVYLLTATAGGPTPDGHISAAILRIQN